MPSRSDLNFLPILVLLLIALVVFTPIILKWAPVANLLSVVPERTREAKPQARVWVNKHSGYYYCGDSKLYGAVQPGEYLSQAKALEAGYRPAAGEPCR